MNRPRRMCVFLRDAFSSGVPKKLFRVVLVVVAVSTGSDTVRGAALAQDGTPVAVRASECTVSPRPTRDLIAVLKAPPGLARDAQNGTPVSLQAPPTGGGPANAETANAVTATAREAVACLNAGDLARLFSLYSENYLVHFWGGIAGPDLSEKEVQERVQALETPKPQPESDQLALIAVDDVEVLPDGRVMATVINNHGESRVVFVKDGDRYLVDWAYPLSGDGTPVQ